jgi:colanic acid/amylovoran biosynthesis protein
MNPADPSSALPITQIIGPWLPNKGNEMTLRAVIGQLGASQTLGVSSTMGLLELPDDLSLHQLAWRPSLRAAMGSGSAGCVARALRDQVVWKRSGVVAGPAVRRLLDCSGFAYGDPWPVRRIRARADHCARLKAQGARLVMLPQTFGPFHHEQTKMAARDLLGHFDLIFARDEGSAVHLLELDLDPEIIYTAPDITHLIPGRLPRDPALWNSRVCLFPNARMLDRTDGKTAARYVAFLAGCIRAVSRCGCDPWILLHERNDLALAREVRMASGIHVHIDDYEALAVKGIIAACRAVISSRYQPLVAALGHGVPVMATGWCHKFSGLLGDYATAEWLVSPRLSDGQAAEKVAALVAPACQKAKRQALTQVAQEQMRKVEVMWQRVDECFLETPAAFAQ